MLKVAVLLMVQQSSLVGDGGYLLLSHAGLMTYLSQQVTHLPTTLLYAYYSLTSSTFSPYLYPSKKSSSVSEINYSNDHELIPNPATEH